MAQQTKKILLFLVEGYSEVTALSGTIKKYIKKKYNNRVEFSIFGCDVTTDYDSNSSNIKKKVYKVVNDFIKENKLKTKDILGIVHLVDTDGAYIDDSFVVLGSVTEYIYSRNIIKCSKPSEAIKRNDRKRKNIEVLIGTIELNNIPYEIYFFSTNLEDVFHNMQNCNQAEKNKLAQEFDNKYFDSMEEFLNLFNDNQIFLKLSYEESWAHIKCGCNSLSRCSNFNIFINK